MSYTKEPWKIIQCHRASCWCAVIVPDYEVKENEKDFVIGDGAVNKEDARRIVACVNACAGLTTEYLEEISGIGFRRLIDDIYKYESKQGITHGPK